MNIISQIENIKNSFSGKITYGESLSKLSWFNIGGEADILFRPKNIKELSFFLREIKDIKSIKVLGAGSNTLIRDGGFKGIIIKFGKTFSHLSLFDKNTIIAGASAFDKSVSKFAMEKSIAGLEFLSCIPGTIGGAVKMNSGCYGHDISKVLVSVQAMDLSGNIRIIKASDINFFYRGTNLDSNLIFISATFKGLTEDSKKIEKKIDDFINRKKNTQPFKIKTCGSTFKNPQGKKAWKLIKESGCAGMKVGDAEISEKHCNFFINNGKAKSKDLEKLIENVQRKVLAKTGIKLELEIKIIGEKNEK